MEDNMVGASSNDIPFNTNVLTLQPISLDFNLNELKAQNVTKDEVKEAKAVESHTSVQIIFLSTPKTEGMLTKHINVSNKFSMYIFNKGYYNIFCHATYYNAMYYKLSNCLLPQLNFLTICSTLTVHHVTRYTS
jgi:hypothetical protein